METNKCWQGSGEIRIFCISSETVKWSGVNHILVIFQKIKLELSYDRAIPLLDIYLNNSKQGLSANICTPISFAYFFFFKRATLAAYGGSQPGGPIGATPAGLQHSYSNARSEPRLQRTSQLMATPDP